MIGTDWFSKKWGIKIDSLGFDEIYERLSSLENEISYLKEENISLTNELYRMENSLDARIDIIAERCKIDYDV